jgi:hypothetical protein
VLHLPHLYLNSILTLSYRDSEIPEGLARDVIKTHKIVSAAVQKLSKGNVLNGANREEENWKNCGHLVGVDP